MLVKVDYGLAKQDSQINWPTVLKVSFWAPFPHGSLVGTSRFGAVAVGSVGLHTSASSSAGSHLSSFTSHGWIFPPLTNTCLTYFMYYFFIFIWKYSVSGNSLDLRPSQVPSAVKTSAEKSLSFSAMALLSPRAPYEPLASCGTAVSLDGFLFSLKQIFTISLLFFCRIFSFFFSYPSCHLFLIYFYGLSCSFQQFFKCQPFCLQ